MREAEADKNNHGYLAKMFTLQHTDELKGMQPFCLIIIITAIYLHLGKVIFICIGNLY